MEIGLIFALLTAVSFGISNSFVRRGTFRAGESFTAVVITISVGLLFFLLIMLFTAEWEKFRSLSWQGFIQLGIAGIIHFVAGRFFSYSSIRLIGANMSSAIIRTQIIYPVVLGIILFKEPLTIFLILGVLCIVAGATLVSRERGDKVFGDKVSKVHAKGVLAGLVGAFCWGMSGLLIKPAVMQLGSPYAGALISYGAAFLVMTGFLLGKAQREQVFQLSSRTAILLAIGGLFTATAQMCRFTALIYSPVSAVEPLASTNVFFILLFSYLINRKIEVFNWRIFTGMVLTVVGAFLFFW